MVYSSSIFYDFHSFDSCQLKFNMKIYMREKLKTGLLADVKACIYCGKDGHQSIYVHGEIHQIECGYCGARGPIERDVRKAAWAWNAAYKKIKNLVTFLPQ